MWHNLKNKNIIFSVLPNSSGKGYAQHVDKDQNSWDHPKISIKHGKQSPNSDKVKKQKHICMFGKYGPNMKPFSDTQN